MLKWWAFIFAIIALVTSADEKKVRAEFDRVQIRLDAIENRKCTLMAVTTPSGVASICALQ
ncbi:hypothetical protein CO683_00955 [Bradyrhizobium ottawaense]|nr:hypothetical protein CO683_00955 [Bradyrhizobium ottawaense]